MLFRRVCVQLGCGSTSAVIPNISGRTILMKHVLCEFFEQDPRLVSATDIRHLYTSITNIISEQVQVAMVADEEGAKASNHSHAVHTEWYKTSILGAEERRFDAYHDLMGETRIWQDCNYKLQLAQVTETQMMRALQGLFGQQASFNSPEQKQMVINSCNSHLKHKYDGLRCGYGKTLALLLPLAIEKTSLHFAGCRIFVLPYVFLVESLLQAFKTRLRNFNNNLTILSFTASSIDDSSTLPPELDATNPPDILILSVDAAANLIEYHPVVLRMWQEANLLRGIFIDEIQTFYAEFNFRQVYQKLKRYTEIGAPIHLLSGSFPRQMVPSLLKSFGLIENRGDISNVEVIQSPDLVGDGLDFEVMRVGGDIITATIQLADHYVRQNNRAVHVLCASKQHCQQFEAKLNNRDDVVVVHSGTTREEQATAAKAWFTSQAKQLYTTSLGTVGNENDELGGIIIVGLLFNLSTLVQIFGRLRPRQRGSHSKVYQLVSDWDLQLNAQVTSRADNIRNDLNNAGHLHADDESMYNEVFHIDGYKRFVSSEGCYFTKLSVLFSDNVSPSCGSHCTWCRHGQRHTLYNYTVSNAQQGTTLQMVTPIRQQQTSTVVTNPYKRKRSTEQSVSPVETSYVEQVAVIARQEQQSSLHTRSIAESKLNHLKVLCPNKQCRFPSCNGEFCLNRACYICHDPTHAVAQCPFKHHTSAAKGLDDYLANKGFCVYCLGKLTGSNEQHGTINGNANDLHCTLAKRLRRALSNIYHQKYKTSSWGWFLRHITSSDEVYYKFIADLDIDIHAGCKM